MGPGRSAALAVPVRLGEHACCHFLEADDRERLAVAFVRDRLRRGHRVVYFFDDDRGAATGDRLERLDPAFEPAIGRGQLEVRCARDAYIPDDRFEPDRMLDLLHQEVDRARADGYRGLDVTGEVPVALCELPGGEQLGAYEAGIAGRMGDPSYSVLCQYDHRQIRATAAVGGPRRTRGRRAAGAGRDRARQRVVGGARSRPWRAAPGRRARLHLRRDRLDGARGALLRSAALKALARRSAVPVELQAQIEAPLPDDVEVAAYYVAAEALTNAAKHARASLVDLDVSTGEGTLTLTVRDDGVGGVDPGRGSGLVGLQDRVVALGGTITIDSQAGSGTGLVVTLPIATEPDPEIENVLSPPREQGMPTSPA